MQSMHPERGVALRLSRSSRPLTRRRPPCRPLRRCAISEGPFWDSSDRSCGFFVVKSDWVSCCTLQVRQQRLISTASAAPERLGWGFFIVRLRYLRPHQTPSCSTRLCVSRADSLTSHYAIARTSRSSITLSIMPESTTCGVCFVFLRQTGPFAYDQRDYQ